MGKREYDEKEKPLVISTDSRQTKRSEQPADSLVEVQETRPQHMGRGFPAVGNTLPGRWDSKSQPVGNSLPNSRN